MLLYPQERRGWYNWQRRRLQTPQLAHGDAIPSTLARPGPFWLAVLLTGIGTSVADAALTRLLEMVRHVVWNGSGTQLLDAAGHAGA